jgi:DNA-binding IclR family transcriptional regulator
MARVMKHSDVTYVAARKEGGLAPAVVRAARILALLEMAPQRRFSLAEIATQLEIPKSTTLNICTELVQAQLLRKSQDGYQLGRWLVQLGSAYVSSVDLVREFYEVCREVPADLEAMIQLSVLDEELNAIYLARQDCNSGLRLGLRAEIGRRVPANCTASGKALLAALDPAEFDRRVAGVRSLPTLTQRSVSSPAELRQQLESIRRQGYSSEDEEVLPGVACVAACARTTNREDGILAISITASKQALSSARLKLMKDVLSKLTESIQLRL